MGGTHNTPARDENTYIALVEKNIIGRDHLGVLRVDGKKILKWKEKGRMRVWSELVCFYALLQNCKKGILASSCMSLRLSAWNNLAATGRIFIKLDV
jgi:hypothetical protein